MSIFHLALDIYFAAVLGTTGIAKIDSPSKFISTLRTQYKFSLKSAHVVGVFFPWCELVLAMLLLLATNRAKMVVTFIVLFLFLLFLAAHAVTQLHGLNQSCGCYGGSPHSQQYTNYGTLLLQVVLASILVVLTAWTPPLVWGYYLLSTITAISVYSWLLWKTWRRRTLPMSKQKAYTSSIPS